MLFNPFLILFATLSSVSAGSIFKRAVAFFPPNTSGGSNLNDAGNGLGEPLNVCLLFTHRLTFEYRLQVIISGLSSPQVLTDSGFMNFANSLGFAQECFGIHLGGPQSANLGDGHGAVNQTMELREDFGNSAFGSCLESLTGGNHLRMFRQNGPSANSGALFLAVSAEEDLNNSHTIEPNGYNIGRDKLVSAATSGRTTFNGVTYSTTEKDVTGLLSSGSAGVNHGISQDGVVKLLTVTVV